MPATPSTQPAIAYITVAQLPNGRVSSVTVSNDYAPDPMEAFMGEPRATVWTTPMPEYEGDPANAVKVLDLALSSEYQDQAGGEWAYGEREEIKFRHDHTGERAYLRNVEARLIRAGFLDAYTGMVRNQGYGLTLVGGNEHYAYKENDGWHFASEDCVSFEGWYARPSTIAPAGASPRRVAAAIVACLADHGVIDTTDLPLLHRAHVRYALWRMTPNWSNFKFRTRKRLDRYRRRITVRTR